MYKILIVEDDETIAGGLKNHLGKWNYQAECMTDFKDVMGKFVDFDPQLVLLDIVLPFFNGFHWCQEIRPLSMLLHQQSQTVLPKSLPVSEPEASYRILSVRA